MNQKKAKALRKAVVANINKHSVDVCIQHTYRIAKKLYRNLNSKERERVAPEFLAAVACRHAVDIEKEGFHFVPDKIRMSPDDWDEHKKRDSVWRRALMAGRKGIGRFGSRRSTDKARADSTTDPGVQVERGDAGEGACAGEGAATVGVLVEGDEGKGGSKSGDREDSENTGVE